MTKFPTKDKNFYFYKFYERLIDKDIDRLSYQYCCDLTINDRFLIEILGNSNVFDIGHNFLPIKFLPQFETNEHNIWCIAYAGSPMIQYNIFNNKNVIWNDAAWYYKAIVYLIDNYYDRFNNYILKKLINSFVKMFLYDRSRQLDLKVDLTSNYYSDCYFIKSLDFECERYDKRLSNLSKDQFRERFNDFINEIRTKNIYEVLLTIYENKNQR